MPAAASVDAAVEQRSERAWIVCAQTLAQGRTFAAECAKHRIPCAVVSRNRDDRPAHANEYVARGTSAADVGEVLRELRSSQRLRRQPSSFSPRRRGRVKRRWNWWWATVSLPRTGCVRSPVSSVPRLYGWQRAAHSQQPACHLRTSSRPRCGVGPVLRRSSIRTSSAACWISTRPGTVVESMHFWMPSREARIRSRGERDVATLRVSPERRSLRRVLRMARRSQLPDHRMDGRTRPAPRAMARRAGRAPFRAGGSAERCPLETPPKRVRSSGTWKRAA